MELQQTLEIQFEEQKENTKYPNRTLKLGHSKENEKKNCTSQKKIVPLQPQIVQNVQETCYELWE